MPFFHIPDVYAMKADAGSACFLLHSFAKSLEAEIVDIFLIGNVKAFADVNKSQQIAQKTLLNSAKRSKLK